MVSVRKSNSLLHIYNFNMVYDKNFIMLLYYEILKVNYLFTKSIAISLLLVAKIRTNLTTCCNAIPYFTSKGSEKHYVKEILSFTIIYELTSNIELQLILNIVQLISMCKQNNIYHNLNIFDKIVNRVGCVQSEN